MECLIPVRLFVLAFAACAVPKAAPPPSDAPAEQELVIPHAIPGEVMEYEASLAGIPLGRAVVAIGEVGTIDDVRVVIAKARAESSGLASALGEFAWEQETTVDLDNGYMLGSRERITARFAGKYKNISITYDDQRQHDVLSASGAARGWRSSIGQRALIKVQIGNSSFAIRAVDVAHELEPMTGKPAVRYECDFAGKVMFTTWISDDVARVPLRTDWPTPFGGLRGILVDYRAPSG